MNTTVSQLSWTCQRHSEVVLTYRRGRRSIISVKAVCSRPTPSIATDTVSIKNLLRGRHHLVDRVAASVRGIGITAQLDCLYFS
ncbi:hypothetical protein BB734_21585 [Mycobacterium avium subsp. hominissuis]|jgi:hypothetical protein|uniref:Transposase n=4 Tax=Mycobacterium avium complex (MAC) TaxID=120793 RepID=A0ABX3TIY3_9MYCO|nr:hypothetical protein [Mycobacterium avium subsp. hominissuis]ORA57113.1 hypothetical protein BST19_04200 [Mycobacterium bouchedurhonense]ORB78748.1 hypothetical protein BST46_17520 [Mycobacterium timonense]PBA23973.1 hypothetical protein CKJ66_25925 [Mycobacterium avium]TXA42487.1 hypothetical protein DKM27_07500 [Mycobacterium tuberculosis variant bovis]